MGCGEYNPTKFRTNAGVQNAFRKQIVGARFLIFSGDRISPSAGQITSTVTSSRQIQFGLKLMF